MKFSVTTLLSATALGASLASPAQAQDNSGTQAETQVLDELRTAHEGFFPALMGSEGALA